MKKSDNKTNTKAKTTNATSNTTTTNQQAAQAAQAAQQQQLQLQANKGPIVAGKKKETQVDVEKMITTKVDIDYIPGLDDDFFKVILPGKN